MNIENFGWILDTSISPDEKLKQGDLVRFVDEKDPLKKVGIVVTADCDLENKKHAKLVTLVSVVSVKTIMENYLLPEDCEKKRPQIESYVFRCFSIENDQEVETKKALLIDEIKKTKISHDDASIVAAKFITDQLTSLSVKEYKAVMNASGSGVKKTDAINRQISDRGDLLILPDSEALEINGCVAWVRQIWQVPLNSIALRTSETRSRDGEKIARLDSPFRYRLTQLMAQVFSDIGLPDIKHSIEKSIEEAY